LDFFITTNIMPHKPQTSKINWPKTPARKAADRQERNNNIAAVSTVGQMMLAASAVPMPRSQKLLRDAAQAVTINGSIGKRAKGAKGKKRAWQHHADNYFEKNNAWDEVNSVYIACIDLLKTSLALTPLLRERSLLTLVGNKKLLTRNIKAITRDTQALAEEMSKIKTAHAEKAGGSKSQEEMMESCMVFSQYVNFMERYDSALMPLIVHASEQLQEALSELATIDPELAGALTTNLNSTLSSIQTIVHEVTGADAQPSPAAVQKSVPVEADV
jgi:hypothetical protein